MTVTELRECAHCDKLKLEYARKAAPVIMSTTQIHTDLQDSADIAWGRALVLADRAYAECPHPPRGEPYIYCPSCERAFDKTDREVSYDRDR